MKLSVKVENMRSSADINKVKNAIAMNEGILACEVKEKGIVSIVFDNYLVTEDDIIDCIEENGYITSNII